MQTNLFDLSQRVAIVTGSARGLGQKLAEGLAEHGARVVVCDLNTEKARAAAERICAAAAQRSPPTWTLPMRRAARPLCASRCRRTGASTCW
jgi:NAD(P)-dependent dehydrogenase (short-subunit alcohol dehydrogenase family)